MLIFNQELKFKIVQINKTKTKEIKRIFFKKKLFNNKICKI